MKLKLPESIRRHVRRCDIFQSQAPVDFLKLRFCKKKRKKKRKKTTREICLPPQFSCESGRDEKRVRAPQVRRDNDNCCTIDHVAVAPVRTEERTATSDGGVYAWAMGRGGPHARYRIKLQSPAVAAAAARRGAAPPSRDSCKQTRVNLKMQIPPRVSLPLRGRI